jgi:hypothetical protein
MKKKLDDIYSGPTATGGGMKAEKVEKDNRTAFVVCLEITYCSTFIDTKGLACRRT